MKRVLVTGASGFIGANLTRRLLADGHEVHIIVKSASSKWRLDSVLEKLEIHKADIRNANAIEKVLCNIKPAWIFHTVAYGGYSWQTDLIKMIETNIKGTINIVQAAIKSGFESLVNTGSSSEYGFKDYPARENEYIDPNSHYALTKAAATHFCRLTSIQIKKHISTLRLYSTYGPWEEPSRLLPTLIRKGFECKLPPLVSPEVAHDFIYINDVVDACILTASNSSIEYGTIFNVGTGTQTSLSEVVELIRSHFRIKEKPEWGSMPNRKWDTTCWIANSDKIRNILGWQPKVTLNDGIKRTINFLKENKLMATSTEGKD